MRILPAELSGGVEDSLGEREPAHLRVQDLRLLRVLGADHPQPLAVRLCTSKLRKFNILIRPAIIAGWGELNSLLASDLSSLLNGFVTRHPWFSLADTQLTSFDTEQGARMNFREMRTLLLSVPFLYSLAAPGAYAVGRI
jgi:hypothetical protein